MRHIERTSRRKDKTLNTSVNTLKQKSRKSLTMRDLRFKRVVPPGMNLHFTRIHMSC